jgi:hypothetical protein
VEELLTNNVVNFQDIQKLNYKQINKVSDKFGEETFNPNDILDLNNYDSESEEEVLKKYNKKGRAAGSNNNIAANRRSNRPPPD